MMRIGQVDGDLGETREITEAEQTQCHLRGKQDRCKCRANCESKILKKKDADSAKTKRISGSPAVNFQFFKGTRLNLRDKERNIDERDSMKIIMKPTMSFHRQNLPLLGDRKITASTTKPINVCQDFARLCYDTRGVKSCKIIKVRRYWVFVIHT